MSPKIARIVVVLPAPFGPRNPTTWPDETQNDRSSSAVSMPKRRVNPEISSTRPPAAGVPVSGNPGVVAFPGTLPFLFSQV
jgi:hypothetical protein